MNNMKKIGVDISHWLWFTLILSLIPLLFSLWRVYSNSQNVDLLANIDQVICHGELLLICCSILAKTLGELMKKMPRLFITKIWITGASTTLMIFTAFAFSNISIMSNFNITYISNTSYIVLCISTLLAISTILLPDKKPLRTNK